MSTTTSGIGKRSLFWFLAVAGMVAVAIVWRTTRALHDVEGVARASDASVPRATELERSEDAERIEGRRENSMPQSKPVPSSLPALVEAQAQRASARFVDEHGAPLAGVELRVAEDRSVTVSGSD